RHHAVDLVGADRPLAQRQRQAGAQLGGVVVAAAAVALDYRGHRQFDALVGGETLVTGQAAAAPADGVALFGHPAVYHLRVGVAAEWASHVRPPLVWRIVMTDRKSVV